MMIDFHSHVLPGIDDGSRNVDESIALLQMEAEQGIGHVVATPHFYPQHHSPQRFLQKRYEAEQRLREAMEKHPGLPKLSIGAEVYYFSGISESDFLNELTIDKKRCILLEMPQSVWTDKMFREMENIQVRQGIIPIVAHVDRYISPFRTHGIPGKLEQLPVLVQANASFFLRSSTRSMAMRMLKKDQIHLLGSDCHNVSSRPPRLGEAVNQIQQKLGQGIVDRIMDYQYSVLGIPSNL